VIALSSGEAELYGMIKGAAITIGLTSLAGDFGREVQGKVHSDASAAIGIVNRSGVGKLRHVRVQYLWLQEKVRDKDIKVAKVLGTENPADLFTKHLPAEGLKKHLERLKFDASDSRADSAPTINVCEYENYAKTEDEDNGEGDNWQENAENVIRHHSTSRSKLFTPLRVQGAPPGKALTPARVTEGVFLNSGTTFRIVDTWTSRSDAHRDLGARWTGSTRFLRRSPQAFNVMSECGGQLARLSHVRSEKGCEDIHSPPLLL